MPRNLEALARALECSVRWLMTGGESPTAYTDLKLVATILGAVSALPLDDEEKARIFIKSYLVASSQPPDEDNGPDGIPLPLPSPDK